MLVRLEAATEDRDLYARLDLGLHAKIWDLSRNRTLQKLLMQVTAPLFAMGRIVRHSNVRGIERAHADHTVMIAALCEGTAGEAAEAIREHITQNREQIRANFKQFVESEREAVP
jgi:DNA-binding GntR family transcriptional regulator